MTQLLRPSGSGPAAGVTPSRHDGCMDDRFALMCGVAGRHHGAVSVDELDSLGVHRRLRSAWVARRLLVRVGPRSYVVAGSPRTWKQSVWAASADVAGHGFPAGRTAAQLLGLDGFTGNACELLVDRAHRNVATPHSVRSTSWPLGRIGTILVAGIRCLDGQRLILESGRFDFSRVETENAIDSAIRKRLVREAALRDAVRARSGRWVRGNRALVDALVDAGGESWLERRFLALLRGAGLPRPVLQRVYRDGFRTVARVDATFPGGFLVEVEGHATHSSRQQRRHDEQRRTEMTLRGQRFVVFTFGDVTDRPDWVAAQVRRVVALSA